MAVVRDERSLQELSAQAGTAHRTEGAWRRWLAWAAVIGVIVAIGLLFLPAGFPDSLTVPAAKPFNAAQDWVIQNDRTNPVFVHAITPFKNAINDGAEQLAKGLERLTWLGLLAIVGLGSAYVAGWRKGLVAAAGFLAIGILGFWGDNIVTLVLVVLSVVIALAIGIPVGIYSARHPGFERVIRPVLDAMQVVPAFSYLIAIVLIFSIRTTTGLIATVIFALPPAIRLTSLGIREVPADAVEAGESFGATDRQLLRKVQLPLAKPAIMVGVNQTIMMALGIVVIASTVGIEGLGGKVKDALEGLHVGAGFAAGIALVFLAIVLDRVTLGWSERDRAARGSKDVRIFGWTISRKIAGALVIVGVIAAIVIGRQVLRQQDFPDAWVISIAAPVDRINQTVVHHIQGFTSGMTDAANHFFLNPLLGLLKGVPWWMVCLGAAAGAWAAARRVGLAVMAFICFAAIGFVGQWDPAMQTLSQVIVGVVFSVAIAIPLGIWSARSDRVQRIMKPILDAMQTLPQFVYLIPVVALFHVGAVPAVIAALVYALPPCIRLTDLGIRQVPSDRVEAAVAFGATDRQLLWKVQLPLAKPSIMLGVNQTIMMVLSVVIIGGLVGGEGLGYQVINGLSHDFGTGLVAGICILLLAIVIDRITQAMGQPNARAASATHPIGWFFGTSRMRRAAVQVGGDEIPGEIPARRGEA